MMTGYETNILPPGHPGRHIDPGYSYEDLMRQGSAESSHPSSELSLPDAHYSDGGMAPAPHLAAFNSTAYNHSYGSGPLSRDSEHQVRDHS